MEKILKSGAKLVVTQADFKMANALRKCVIKAMKGIPLGPNILDVDMDVVKETMAELASSDDVERCIFQCAEKATYDGAKIDAALFDDPKLGTQARQDMHEMMVAIAQENVGPFFEQALSGLKPLLEKLKQSLESRSTQTTT